MLLNKLPLDMLPPRATLLAQDVALLSLSAEDGADRHFLSGRRPPYGTVEVQAGSGQYRIAALRLTDASERADGDGNLCAPVVLGSDVAEVAEELDTASRRRLLGFLLGFCRKAFALGSDPDFASSCIRLARLCIPDAGITEPVATVASAWFVLRGPNLPQDVRPFVLGSREVRPTNAPRLEGYDTLHLVERVAPGDVLLALTQQPSMWTVGKARPAMRDLVHSRPGDNELRAACLRALAPVSPVVATHLRETELLAPAAPRRHDDASRPIGAALEAALPDGEGRIFLRGWMRDPMHLVASVELLGPTGTVSLTDSGLHRFRRRDLEGKFAKAAFADPEPQVGFVAYVADPCAGLSLQPTLSLRLHSGRRVAVTPAARHPTPEAARTAVLTSVPLEDVTDAMLDDCLGPAAAAFHRRTQERPGTAELVQIGTPVGDPTVSIVIPLYRNLAFVRFQIAAFARDSQCRAAELIVVLDSPEQRAEAEHLLRGLHALYEFPMTFLVLPRNRGYAAANNEGAAHARAPALLLLNSDVVPAGPGWLGELRQALSMPQVGAVGPKLLFDDGSLQHAGLFFQRGPDSIWLNAHYFKGMPRAWPEACRARLVPAVTGAALLVRRELFTAVGGICEDYIVGDYEDSDFCLRLHDAEAHIAYVPCAELFHFERRSIALHNGYAGTLACRYNRRLHHRRWDAQVSALMAQPGFQPGLPERAG